jgi:Na+-transporting methylmalonyl-CoA/oxaloacetate decarboxylase gamma subunit
MILHDIANLSEGTNILIVGISVVFLVLLIMVLFINYMKPIIDYFYSLISMAIYMYLAEQHDYESGVVTIKTVRKAYSPWNSKIYGMNNTLNR